jgi:plastocyanin
LLKVAVALLAAAVIGVACAPREEQPDIPLSLRSQFLTYTPDSVNDAGRVPSVALDDQGNPVVSYLLLEAILKKGDIPPPVIPGQPQPPAVMLATLTAKGIWGRFSVTPQKNSPAEGDAPDLANKERQVGPAVSTGLAVDAQGKHHVVWSTEKGVFYSTDAAGSFVAPEQVTKQSALGASIAVGDDGTPWVSYYAAGSVEVASGSGSKWATQSVGKATPPGNPWTARTAVRVSAKGEPVVAFGDKGATVVAARSGGGWKTDRVPGAGGVAVSLALDKDGNPHVAYYDSDGGVHHAHSVAGAAWEVTDLGQTTAASPQPSAGQQGPEDPRWGTSIALDDEGTHYIVWTDTKQSRIELSTNRGGKFSTQFVSNSEGGATPSIAVSADGRSAAIAWYATAEEDLNVATSGRKGFALAFSPQPPSRPSPGQAPPSTGTEAACKPKGGATDLSITAPTGAAASGYDETCLAVGAGKAFTVGFKNDDQGVPHNWSLYTDSSAQDRPKGAPSDFEIVTGPGEATYKLPALDEGDYYFHCDVHPTTMSGTLVVAKA